MATGYDNPYAGQTGSGKQTTQPFPMPGLGYFLPTPSTPTSQFIEKGYVQTVPSGATSAGKASPRFDARYETRGGGISSSPFQTTDELGQPVSQQPTAKTISQQVASGQPSQIGSGAYITSVTAPERIGFFDAIGKSLSNIYFGFQTEGLSAKAFDKGFISPFTQVGQTKGEYRAAQQTGFIKPGTTMPDEYPFYTLGDFQKNLEEARDIKLIEKQTEFSSIISGKAGEIQSEINLGRIDLGMGEQQLGAFVSELQPGYEKDVLGIYKAYPDIISKESYTIRTGTDIPKFAGIGLDVGVAWASIPAPALGIGYFGGKALYSGTKKPELDIAFQDIQSSLKLEGGRIISEETPLMKEYKGYRTEALLNLGAAGLSAVNLGIQTAKNVRLAELETFASKPYSLGGVEAIKTDTGSLLKVSLSKTTGVASSEAELLLPIKATAGGYKVGSGVGVESFRYSDFMKRGVVTSGDDIIKSVTNFRVSAEGFNVGQATRWGGDIGLKLTDATGSYGTYIYSETGKGVSFVKEGASITKILDTQIKIGKFGGVAQSFDDITKVASGDIFKLKLTGATKEGLPLFDISGKRITEKAIRFVPSSIGEIKTSLADYTFSIADVSGKGYGLPSGLGGLAQVSKTTTSIKSIAPSVFEITKQASLSSVSAVQSITTTTSALPSFGAGGLALSSSVVTRQVPRSFSVAPLSMQQLTSGLTKTRQIGGLVSLPGSGTILLPRTRQGFIPGLMQPEIFKTPQLQQGKLITPMFPVSITPIIPAFGVPGLTGFAIPLLPLPAIGFGEQLGRGFKTKRTFKYTPSIGAILKGIKAPKIGKAEKFAELSGVFGRPIITGRSSKRKPSSKKRK